MSRLHEQLEHVLEHRKITDGDVRIIKNQILSDGKLDNEDVKYLVQLLADATDVCPAFDELFFPVLKAVILRDGRIDQGEQFYLLKMIYSGKRIRESELQFLKELGEEAQDVSAEFTEMCRMAAEAHPTKWDVDGEAPSESSLANSGW